MNKLFITLLLVVTLGIQFANATNNCLTFNGTTQYVQSPSASIPTSGDFTVSVWAKHDPAQNAGNNYYEIISQGGSGDAFYIGKSAAGKIRVSDTWDALTTNFPTDYAWHHYTVVKTSTNAYLYFDGVLAQTLGKTIANPSNTIFTIGKQYGSNAEYFKGSIDEVQTWNRALSACDIASVYKKTLNGTEPGLTHYYSFDQASGSSLTDVVAANNGTTFNSPSWDASAVGFGTLAVTTSSTSVNSNTSVSVTGNITLGTATSRGVVYGTSSCPDINGSKVSESGSFVTGAFTSTILGLTPNTIYYARAYATNASGTSYGMETSFRSLNNCLGFNGTNYVSLGNFGAVNSWTIDCWFNSSDVVNYRNLLQTNYSAGGSNIGVRVEQYTTNAMSVVVAGVEPFAGMTILADGTIFANQWHHLAIVGDKTNSRVYAYIDGVLKNSMACTNWPATFDNFDIGHGFCTGREFVGALDKVNVWNRALSSSEVIENMTKIIVGTESGLISSYNFNQTSGTTLTDIKGAHNGTLVSSPTWQQVANNTLDFDGVNDFVTIPDNNSLDITQMTIETWIKWNPSTATDIQFVCAKSIEQMEIHTGAIANRLRFIPTPGVYLDVPNCLPVNQWTHIACVYNPSATFAAIYINGVLTPFTNSSSLPLTTAIANSTYPLLIGKRGNDTFPFKGTIEEFKLWNTVRTQAQIQADMVAEATGKESGLAAYYNFNLGLGSADNTALTTLIDKTSNANNGTLTNFTKTGSTSNFIVSSGGYPVLTACGVTSISQTSVSVSSDITSIGFQNPTVRGICYATTSAPTILSAKVETTGSYSTGAFTTTLTGLTQGTVYYARSYATNTNGTGYGPEVSFTLSIATNALAFDGTDDVVTIPDAANLNPGTQNWSIEFWFNSADANTLNAQHIFNKESLYEAKVSGGYLTYALMPAWDWRGGTTFAVLPNTWYHCAIVYDHSNIYLYKNGVLVNTEAKTGDMGTTIYPLLFAYRSLGGLPEYRYNGKIDEFRLWNTARSACEIATNYNVGITGTETNLVAYYKFNEASGTTLTDLAGGDNNGTLSSFNGTATSGWVVSNAALTNSNSVAVSTTGSSSVAQTTATVSGNVTYGTATESGVAYSTSHCPVISGTKAIQTVGSGAFSASLTGLETSTIYYARAYATNASGTSYGAEVSFTTQAMTAPGNALVFDGLNDWVAPSVGDIPTITNNFTFEMWVNPTATHKIDTEANTGIAGVTVAGPDYHRYAIYPYHRGSTTDCVAGISIGTNGVSVYEHWSGNITPLLVWSGAINGWTHIAVVYTNKQPSLYVNGVLVRTGLTSGRTNICPSTLLGGWGTNIGSGYGWYQGAMDEVRIWNRALTLSEIQADMKIEQAGTESGLKAYYNFNQGVGLANNTALSTLVDKTSIAINGTLTNFSKTGATSNFIVSTVGYPILAASTSANITQTTTAVSSNITSIGWNTPTVRGVCYASTTAPTITSSKVETSGTYATGAFTSNLIGLTPNTLYYARAYATNTFGTSYGAEVSFTTLAPIVPTLDATTAVSAITSTTATSGGNVTSDGWASVTARGVCWGTTSNPALGVNNFTTNSTGTGSFTSSIAGLITGTTYYVRSYATNSAGTSYGTQVSFTTSALATLAATTSVSEITSTTAASGGNITSDGGASVTARGVCWNTTENPVLGLNNYTTNTSGTGSFTSSISGLTIGTTYYVRSYATNSVGTSYGAQVNFTTWGVPILSATTSATAITATTATSGGNITSDNGSSVTARGVCWGTTSYPALGENNFSNGTETGSFTSSITGLTAGTIYYVRAYATNSVGTGYGPQVSFTYTNAVDKPLSDLINVTEIVVPKDKKVTTDVDNQTINNITIQAGGELELKNPVTVTGNVTFKSDDANSFSALIDKPMTMSESSTLHFVKTMQSNRWYFMSFPCDVLLTDITQVGGTLGALNTTWYINEYDGASRITNLGKTTNWIDFVGSTLLANKGYIIALDATKGTQDISFKLNKALVTAAENTTRKIDNKLHQVITAYGATSLVASNHKGWNLVGQPFLSKFNGANVSGGTVGTGDTEGTALAYMSFPIGDGATYSQSAKESYTNIEPFSAYFVQVDTEIANTGISFATGGRHLAPSAVAVDLSDRVQLNFTSATGADNTNLVMDNNQTIAYEMNKDLEKMIGTGTAQPQVYTLLGGINYAYNALPVASVNNLSVGFYTKTATATTISAVATAPSLSSLLLKDNVTGTVTDLLTTSYKFTPTAAGTNTTRFTITAQRIPTENVLETENGGPTLLIDNYKLIMKSS